MTSTIQVIDQRLKRWDSSSDPDEELVWDDEEIAKLEPVIQAIVGTKPRRLPAREYEHDDVWRVFVASDGQATDESASGDVTRYQGNVRLSFLKPYAAIDWYASNDGKTWHYLSAERCPERIRLLHENLQNKLVGLGCEVLDEATLRHALPNRAMELDGAQATVFSALFSEV
jgi:hypothetical protein